jgi:hypothetical protein
MSSRATNAYVKQANTISEWVWLINAAAMYEGQGVCYNWDYGTASAADPRRYNCVELPTILNAPYFAGVLARPAAISTTGQLVEIYRPGSVCQILAKKSLTIGVGRVTCQAGGTYAGYFTAEGFEGKGSAVPLQTLDTSATAALTLAVLEDGVQSGLTEIVTGKDGGAAGGAITCMVGGVTHFATSTNGADCTFTLADGTQVGQKKRFVVDGTQTTHGVVITVTTGFKLDQTTGITSVEGNTAARAFQVEWLGAAWYTRVNTFDTIS